MFLSKKEKSGMQLDETVLVTKKNVEKIFGNRVDCIDSRIAAEHMGFFRVRARYVPLDYSFYVEHMEGRFEIYIEDNDNGMVPLSQYKQFEPSLSIDNIKKALIKLNELFIENNFELMIEKDGKYYYKNSKSGEMRRIKN